MEAFKSQELRGERLIRRGRLAAERIPRLAAAVSRYMATFETLVEAYESIPVTQAQKIREFSS